MLSPAARKATEHHVQPADLREAQGQSGQSDQTCVPSLSVTFDLDASCYATVCLGEIMKCNLS